MGDSRRHLGQDQPFLGRETALERGGTASSLHPSPTAGYTEGGTDSSTAHNSTPAEREREGGREGEREGRERGGREREREKGRERGREGGGENTHCVIRFFQGEFQCVCVWVSQHQFS